MIRIEFLDDEEREYMADEFCFDSDMGAVIIDDYVGSTYAIPISNVKELEVTRES